jgi:Ca2+-binding EF-hand superfamily protein
MGVSSSRIISLDGAKQRLYSADYDRYSQGFDSMTAQSNNLLDKPAFMDYVLGRGAMGRSNSVTGPGSDMPIELAERIFAVFNTAGSGFINKAEFLCGMAIFKAGSAEERLRFIFNVYDEDRSGFISKEEIHKYLTVLKDTTTTIKHLSPQQKLEQTFDQADTNKDQRLSFEEFAVWAKSNMMPGLITWIWEVNNAKPPQPQPLPQTSSSNNNSNSNTANIPQNNAAQPKELSKNGSTNEKPSEHRVAEKSTTEYSQLNPSKSEINSANGANSSGNKDMSVTAGAPSPSSTISTLQQANPTEPPIATAPSDPEAPLDSVPPMLSLWRGRCKTVAAITHFNEKEITELEKQYHRIRAVAKTVDTQILANLFSPTLPADLLQRIFAAFVTASPFNGSSAASTSGALLNSPQTVDVREFICGLSSCCRGTQEEKLKFVFKIFDENQDGQLDRTEMKNLLASMWKITQIHTNLTQSSENGSYSGSSGLNSALSASANDMEPLVQAIFEQFDLDRDEFISYGEFRAFASTNPAALLFFTKIREFASIHLGVKPTEAQQEKEIIAALIEEESKKERESARNRENQSNLADESTYYVVSSRWITAWCNYSNCSLQLFKQLHYETTDSFVNNRKNAANAPSSAEKEEYKSTQSIDIAVLEDLSSPLSPQIDNSNLKPSAIDNSDILLQPELNSKPIFLHALSIQPSNDALPANNPKLEQNLSITAGNSGGTSQFLQLRPNLVEFVDYFILSEQIWSPLSSWYSVNNQIIRRKRLKVGNRRLIELYPLIFYIKTLKDVNTAREPRDASKKVDNATLLPVSSSRIASLQSLKRKICARLNQPLEKMRIWDCFDAKNPRLLEQNGDSEGKNNNSELNMGELTLEDALLQNGQEIFMELQLENGKWPGFPHTTDSSGKEAGESTKGKGMKLITAPNAGLVGLYNLGNTW